MVYFERALAQDTAAFCMVNSTKGETTSNEGLGGRYKTYERNCNPYK